jgi:prolyl-tRNA synthetase
MKDSYSLDTDWDGLDRQYQAHYQAYFNIFRRCGLQVIAVSGDVGMMGGKLAHEFMFLTPIGEDSLLICQQCGYSANRQVAVFRKQALPAEAALPLEKVATPDCKTIESLANFLHIPASHTAKAVFMIASVLTQAGKADERFIFAITRGDMEINETKLANAVNARSLRPATEKEIKAVGAEPGYASPVGLQNQSDSKPIVVADELIPQSANLVSGANEAGFHLLNVNFRRDYTADIVQDITAARDGDGCPQCGHPLQLVRGVEVGNIFKLGARFSDDMGCTFQDKDGQEKPVIMGSYGIGLGRLLACVAEAHHDEKGLIWPVTVSPFQVHLVVLMGRPDAGETSASANQPAEMAESLYQLLRSQGIDILYDDRIETPGVKFNDADLIGNPLRLTVSERSLKQGGVEAIRRDRTDKVIVPIDQVLEWVKHEIAELNSEIMAAVKTEIGKFD